jgi:hypothetical protein
LPDVDTTVDAARLEACATLPCFSVPSVLADSHFAQSLFGFAGYRGVVAFRGFAEMGRRGLWIP